MKKYFYVLCLLISTNAVAQAPVSETIHVNSVEAKVWSNGNLFGYGNERGFKVPASDDNDSIKIATFRRVVPWMGGYDDFDNLKIACASPTSNSTINASDFTPGIIGVEGYNQIWKITKAEIQAHRADFEDNGVIDNPVTAVMDWPGTLTLPQYPSWPNPLVSTKVAPFYDIDDNNIYEPLSGDFPLPQFRAASVRGIPDEMLFFAFHDNGPLEHPHTHGRDMEIQVFCTVWAFFCPEEPALNNSIFVSMEYLNTGTDPLNALHLGFLMNFEIGNNNDDFIGSIPNKNIYYGYNGDDFDQNGFGNASPVVGVFRIGHEPLIPIGSPYPVEYFMQINAPGSMVPTAIGYPASPQRFYNYLTGHWQDGTPLRMGGNGYHPQDTSAAARLIYPGDPTDTTGWSEPTAGNIPGHRLGLVSYYSVFPQFSNRIKRNFCFNWARQTNADNPLKAALEQIQSNEFFMDQLISYDPQFPVATPSCLSWNSTATVSPQTKAISISPNPTTGTCHLSYPDGVLEDIAITDLHGQTVFQQHTISTSEITLDLRLPSGMYFLTATTSDNKRLTQKLIIAQ